MKINKSKKNQKKKNLTLKRKHKKSKKKGGGTEEIKRFLHYIVNNKYPEDVESDDNILFGYKKNDLKYIKPLNLITEDDLEAIANETANSIDFEQEIAQKRINRLHKFKLHILDILHNFNEDIENTNFPTTRTVNFLTPPQENTRREPNPPRIRVTTGRPRPSELTLDLPEYN
tara:strand:- start:3491 stop:4009 length:519 start_codon:yes stop_codon:yes gene_type:complete